MQNPEQPDLTTAGRSFRSTWTPPFRQSGTVRFSTEPRGPKTRDPQNIRLTTSSRLFNINGYSYRSPLPNNLADLDPMTIRRFDSELSHAPWLVRNAVRRFDAGKLDLSVVSVHVIDS